MKSKLILSSVFVLLVNGTSWSGGLREVVFAGISAGGAPSIEQSFDRSIRTQISTQPDITLADYVETQNYNRVIRFQDFPSVSRKLVESIERFASDTTLFVWGYVEKHTVTPIRTNLFFAKLKCELDLRLTIYSLAKKQYAYCGKIHTEELKPAGMILTGDVTTLVHVSASDNAELTDKCIDKAALNAVEIINAIRRSQTGNEPTPAQAANIEAYKVPSISDVFSVPSIEAKQVEPESDSGSKGKK